MVAYLKLLIAKMKRERFGQSAERGRKLLDQLELRLEASPAGRRTCGDLVQYASGQCPPSRGHDGKWITKDRATRVPRPVAARVIVMSFDLRLAVKGMAPASRLG